MSTEDMEKYRILESDKRYRAADRWLDNFSAASWSEVRTSSEVTYLLTR